MKFVNQISIFSIILISLIIFSTISPSVAGENIDAIMTEGQMFALNVGSLYVLYPEQTYQRDNLTISVAFFQTTEELVQGDIFLYKNGEQLTSVNKALDLENGDTYLLMEWNENLMDNASYSLTFDIDNEEVFSKDFEIETKEKIIVDKQVEQTRIPNNANNNENSNTNDNLDSTLGDLIKSSLDYTNLELENALSSANKHLTIDKTLEKETLFFMDNTSLTTSTIYITITPDTTVDSMTFVENIPKSIANSVSELIFSSEPIVLEEDPIIMWQIKEEFNKTQTFSYEVEKDVSITGNTVLLANVAADQEKTFNWNILFALLLIPIIAGVIIYFSKFGPKK